MFDTDMTPEEIQAHNIREIVLAYHDAEQKTWSVASHDSVNVKAWALRRLEILGVTGDAAEDALKSPAARIGSPAVPPPLIAFRHDSREIGRLWVEDDVLKFAGDLDAGAREFFEWFKPMVDGYIADRKKLRRR